MAEIADWLPDWAGMSPRGPAIVASLVEAGADPNARDINGWTPLHQTPGLAHDPAVVAWLVEAGADPNARENDGWTPLHVAAKQSDDPAVVVALLEGGADPNAREDTAGGTPLHVGG